MYYRFLFVCICSFLSGYVMAQSPVTTTQNQPVQEQLIRIYGSADCHYCSDAKSYLDQRKTPYLFFDIDRDPVALREMLAKLKQAGIPSNGVAIPVVEKKGELFMNNIPFDDFLKKLD